MHCSTEKIHEFFDISANNLTSALTEPRLQYFTEVIDIQRFNKSRSHSQTSFSTICRYNRTMVNDKMPVAPIQTAKFCSSKRSCKLPANNIDAGSHSIVHKSTLLLSQLRCLTKYKKLGTIRQNAANKLPSGKLETKFRLNQADPENNRYPLLIKMHRLSNRHKQRFNCIDI
jgi:hypothetical protein